MKFAVRVKRVSLFAFMFLRSYSLRIGVDRGWPYGFRSGCGPIVTWMCCNNLSLTWTQLEAWNDRLTYPGWVSGQPGIFNIFWNCFQKEADLKLTHRSTWIWPEKSGQIDFDPGQPCNDPFQSLLHLQFAFYAFNIRNVVLTRMYLWFLSFVKWIETRNQSNLTHPTG